MPFQIAGYTAKLESSGQCGTDARTASRAVNQRREVRSKTLVTKGTETSLLSGKSVNYSVHSWESCLTLRRKINFNLTA